MAPLSSDFRTTRWAPLLASVLAFSPACALVGAAGGAAGGGHHGEAEAQAASPSSASASSPRKTFALFGASSREELERLEQRTLNHLAEGNREAEGARPAAEPPLTLSQAIQLAWQTDALLAQREAEVGEAHAELRDALGMDNPELKVGKKDIRQLLKPGQIWELDLVVNLPHPVDMVAAVALARAKVETAQAKVESRKRELLDELRSLYDLIRLYTLEQEAAHIALSAQDRLESLARERLRVNVSTQLEVQQAAQGRAEVAFELEALKARQEAVEGALHSLLGPEAAHRPLDLKDPSMPPLLMEAEGPNAGAHDLTWQPSLKPLPSEEDLIRTAFRNHPSLQEVAANLHEKQAEHRQALADLLPSVKYLQFGYTLEPLPYATGYSPWSVGAGVEVPIPGFNTNGAHQARAAVRVARSELYAEAQTLERDIVQSRIKASAAARIWQAYQDGPVKAAAESEQEVLRALNAGKLNLLEAALIQERNARASLKRIQLLKDYVEALAELRTAVGGTLPGWESDPATTASTPTSPATSPLKGGKP